VAAFSSFEQWKDVCGFGFKQGHEQCTAWFYFAYKKVFIGKTLGVKH
jgi:hypothetical protein